MTVNLEWYEAELATYCGILRFFEARRFGLNVVKHAAAPANWNPCVNDIEASGAEMAVAKGFRKYWMAGVNTFDSPDVAPNFEVRYTTCPNGRLIVRPDDADDRWFVLVYGAMPNYEIIGGILGRDAKQEQWLENPNGDGPCYMVPADQLTKPK